MQEAMLWIREGKKIKCELCAWRCLIPEGEAGICKVRVNKDGILYTKNYGKIVYMDVDPIEKKPLFHFYPGSQTLSISSVGCNFKCQFCINWETSQIVDKITGEKYSPEDIVKIANKKKIKIIAYTYTEPTIFFEFAYRVSRIAKRYNIKNVFVTNGYITSEAIKKIGKYLDAVTVDFKASGNSEFYKKYMGVPNVEPIFDSLKNFHKHRVFIEISNLIIPGVGDSQEDNRKLVEWIVENLDSSIPYHLVGFSPCFNMSNVQPTTLETLEKLANDAKIIGLRYPYIGNIWGSSYENTFCYNCGYKVIERTGVFINNIELEKDRCPNCGFKINIIKD
jgi:pyruvate formate lyase activating enzyme